MFTTTKPIVLALVSTALVAAGAPSAITPVTPALAGTTPMGDASAAFTPRSGAPGHETDFVITPDGVFKTRMTDPDQFARIDHTDVHALLLYNRDTRAGYLLEQPPDLPAISRSI